MPDVRDLRLAALVDQHRSIGFRSAVDMPVPVATSTAGAPAGASRLDARCVGRDYLAWLSSRQVRGRGPAPAQMLAAVQAAARPTRSSPAGGALAASIPDAWSWPRDPRPRDGSAPVPRARHAADPTLSCHVARRMRDSAAVDPAPRRPRPAGRGCGTARWPGQAGGGLACSVQRLGGVAVLAPAAPPARYAMLPATAIIPQMSDVASSRAPPYLRHHFPPDAGKTT